MALSAAVGLSGEDNQKCTVHDGRKGYESEPVRSGDPPSPSVVGWLERKCTQYPWNSNISARVVAQLATSQGISVYGIEFKERGDISNGFWGISFPPLESRGASAQVAEQAGIARRIARPQA